VGGGGRLGVFGVGGCGVLVFLGLGWGFYCGVWFGLVFFWLLVPPGRGAVSETAGVRTPIAKLDAPERDYVQG